MRAMSSGSDASTPVSVPPPGFVSRAPAALTAPAHGADPVGASAGAAEAAVRWRISAAAIDNILVGVLYLVLCALLGWRVATLSHLAVSLVIGVVYHFVLESRTGQTVGKRQYGIQVVALDGSPADARAVAIRSVLRLVDQLPIFYVSGLVSMVRTGPQRRQRIGDVAAGTTVVAVDGYAAARGTPGWLLPAVTLFAAAASALCLYLAVTAPNRPLNSAQRAGFVAGCDRSPAGAIVDCNCLLDRLEADGYSTPSEFRSLDAALVSDPRARAALAGAATACRR
jgi:uncharacterized RDD family membrane protein YckC